MGAKKNQAGWVEGRTARAALGGAALVAVLSFGCGARSTVDSEQGLPEASSDSSSERTVRANNATGPRNTSDDDSERDQTPTGSRSSTEEALDELELPRTECGLTCAHLYASCPDAYDFDCLRECEGAEHGQQFLECCRQEVFSAGTCARERRNGLDVRDCDDSGRCVDDRDSEPVGGVEAPGPLIVQACQALCEYLGSQCAGQELRPQCPSECGAWAADLGSGFPDAALCCAQRTFSTQECRAAPGGVGVQQLCDSEARGCLF